MSVHPDSAASALPLWAAAILGRANTQDITKDVEQRSPVVGHHDGLTVNDERERRPDRRGELAQLKDDPQPQVRVAFGLEMWNPAPCKPSE